MLKQLPYIISGFIVGIILFQSSLIAPAINNLTSPKEASILLRYIWPKFFITIGSLSLISFLLFNNNSQAKPVLKYLSLCSFLFMSFCYFIIPMINEAKDFSNDQLWFSLHLTTIIMTLIVFVFNLFTIASLKYFN